MCNFYLTGHYSFGQFYVFILHAWNLKLSLSKHLFSVDLIYYKELDKYLIVSPYE